MPSRREPADARPHVLRRRRRSEALAGQTVAIIGYGSQGHAHALNLKESGVDVVVGLKPGSKSRALAEGAGLRVADVADAVKQADVVMILVPDTEQKKVYDAEIGPNLRPGQLLMFAHGFNIRFDASSRPPMSTSRWWRPKGPGHLLRSVYQSGRSKHINLSFCMAHSFCERGRKKRSYAMLARRERSQVRRNRDHVVFRQFRDRGLHGAEFVPALEPFCMLMSCRAR